MSKDVVLAGRYRPVKTISDFTAGETNAVYLAEYLQSSGGGTADHIKEFVVLKLVLSGNGVARHRLKNERDVYLALGNGHEQGFIPKILDFVECGCSLLVMEELGPSIEDVVVRSGSFPINVVVMLAYEMLIRVEFLHAKGYVHRDIRSTNFLFRREEKAKPISLINMGNAAPFILDDRRHIPASDGHKLKGSLRYVSHNVQMGMQPSRRDDLISLGYLFAVMLRGKLPWQGLPSPKSADATAKRIAEVKLKTSPQELFKGCPKEFVDFLAYCLALEFEEEPDYGRLKQLFAIPSFTLQHRQTARDELRKLLQTPAAADNRS